MNRDRAYHFLKVAMEFEKLELKVVDTDPDRDRVELQFSGGDKAWFDVWEAAKVIEALS